MGKSKSYPGREEDRASLLPGGPPGGLPPGVPHCFQVVGAAGGEIEVLSRGLRSRTRTMISGSFWRPIAFLVLHSNISSQPNTSNDSALAVTPDGVTKAPALLFLSGTRHAHQARAQT